MSKLILSGDLTYFRVEMLVRILEAIKLNAEVSIESQEKGQVYFLQGKIVGANTATDQGVPALNTISAWKIGTFSVRLAEDMNRHADLLQFPDNQAIFRHLHAQAGQGAIASNAAAKGRVPAAASAAAGAGPPGMSGMPSMNSTMGGAGQGRTSIVQRNMPKAGGAGPLARVPELTDKGRIAIRSIQTNYALRGVQVEADTWRVLGKVDGQLSLYQIGEGVGILGDRLIQVVEELQQQGYLRFATHDPSTDHLKQTKFRIGEYMVAKGIITEVQLEAALRRQSELARKGRYMWLGEILVEMNYARPSQVQEAMAMQKRQQGG